MKISLQKPQLSKKIPLTYQLTRILRDRITGGDYFTGFQLPSEPQLAQDFGVSVITIRAVLRALSDDGLIRRERGRGTFVAEIPPNLRKLNAVVPLNFLYAQELGRGTRILERGIVPVPSHLQSLFGSDAALALYRRLECHEGQPRSYSVQYFPACLNDKIDDTDLQKDTMTTILPRLGVRIKRVEVDMTARLPTLEIAEILEIEATAPVMQARVVGLDEADRPVTAMEITLAGDRFTYHVEMEL